MSSTTSSPLTGMFAELNKTLQVNDYKQALKLCNKIIHSKEGNTDEKAMHCKVVCMINLNQFAEALKFIKSTPEISSSLIFERAYSQYRLIQTDEALETIKEAKELDVRLTELKAQVLYKLGYYDESFELYKRLIKECSDDYEDERKSNLIAVHASNTLWKKKQQVDVELELTSYEQMYNKSCKLLGDGDAAGAIGLLEDALENCKAYYEDDSDMTEEDIEGEVAVIKVQMGYALQLQGKEDEALQLYNQVIKSRPDDIGLVAVASNNIITINREQNVFDSKKKLKATMVQGLRQKLVLKQLIVIDMNRALLYLYSNQWEMCKKVLKSLQQENKSDDVPCLIQAVQLCREKNYEKAISFLEDFIETHSDPDVHSIDLANIKLALVQILLGQGKVERVCAILESMHEIKYTPGIMSILVALHDSRKGGEMKAIQILNDAIAWHIKNKTANEIVVKLLWESACYKLNKKHPKQAAENLEQMRRLDPKNVKVLAQLIFAYSQFNRSKAHQISEALPSLEQMSVAVNVEKLEADGPSVLAPRFLKRQQKQQKKLLEKKQEENSQAKGDDKKEDLRRAKETVSEVKIDPLLVKKGKKKRKKRKLPKNMDPAVEPDPERWIPLRERSYYKGRRKDRRKNVTKGTQGSSTMSSEYLDMSAKIQTPAQAPGSPGSSGSTPASPRPGSVPLKQPPLNSPKPSTGARPKSKQTARGKKKKGGKGGW